MMHPWVICEKTMTDTARKLFPLETLRLQISAEHFPAHFKPLLKTNTTSNIFMNSSDNLAGQQFTLKFAGKILSC